jgi:hypothetical protein
MREDKICTAKLEEEQRDVGSLSLHGDRICTAKLEEEQRDVGSLSLHGDRIGTARRQDRNCTAQGGAVRCG